MREQEFRHRSDVAGGVILGGDVMLRDSATQMLRQFVFQMLEVVDLLANEIGDGAVLIES